MKAYQYARTKKSVPARTRRWTPPIRAPR